MLSGNFAKMTSTPFRDLLHAANLRRVCVCVCVSVHIYLCIHVYYDDQIVTWKYDTRHIQASVQFHSLAVLVHRIYTDFKITGWV